MSQVQISSEVNYSPPVASAKRAELRGRRCKAESVKEVGASCPYSNVQICLREFEVRTRSIDVSSAKMCELGASLKSAVWTLSLAESVAVVTYELNL